MEVEIVERACKEILGKELRPFQRIAIEKLSDEIKKIRPRPILIRLPTGYGKTLVGESVLLYEAVKGDWSYARGLTYVLPTRAITHDIAERIKGDLKKLHIMDVKEIHGESDATDFYADVSATTFDTFLYAFARKTHDYHLERPAGVIATSYVVFDEAHMLQDEYLYSHSIMSKLVYSLYEAGVPTIVMTATLPKCIEDVIFKRVKPLRVPEDLSEFREGIASYRGSIRCVQVKGGTHLFDYLNSSDFRDEIKQRRRILIVANTVERAIKAFKIVKESIRGDWKVILIHSRMRLCDRRSHEDTIRRLLQSEANGETPGVIVIATQVVEAGLDASCELLVTECAPADALVQRAGRCARRVGEEGTCVILKPANYEPYPKNLIDKTLILLSNMSDRERIESLTTLRASNEFINEAYKDFKPEEFSVEKSTKKRGRKMKKEKEEFFEEMMTSMKYTLRYLENIYPFIVDSEAIERVRARPSAPIFIFAPVKDEKIKAYLMSREDEKGGGHYRLKDILEESIDELVRRAIELQRTEALFFEKEVVRERLFTVEKVYLTRGLCEALLFRDLGSAGSFIASLSYTRRSLRDVGIESRALLYKLELEPVRDKEPKIREGTYVLNPDYYHKEFGFFIGR